jgi:hypothetical protein
MLFAGAIDNTSSHHAGFLRFRRAGGMVSSGGTETKIWASTYNSLLFVSSSAIVMSGKSSKIRIVNVPR